MRGLGKELREAQSWGFLLQVGAGDGKFAGDVKQKWLLPPPEEQPTSAERSTVHESESSALALTVG